MRSLGCFYSLVLHLVKSLYIILCCAATASTSCISTSDFQALGQAVQRLEQISSNQQTEIATLKAENRHLWRGLRCTNQQVDDFMTESEKCASGQCPARDFERVLGYMIGQRHVLVRLKPGQRARDMAPIRLAQLQDMLKGTEITPLSRMLMLTVAINLDRDDTVKLPDVISWDLLSHIRRDLQLASTTGCVGPFPVNTGHKSKLIEVFNRKILADKLVPSEPKSNEPQVAIWVFKVDC